MDSRHSNMKETSSKERNVIHQRWTLRLDTIVLCLGDFLVFHP